MFENMDLFPMTVPFSASFFLNDHLLEILKALERLFCGIPNFRITASGKDTLRRPDRTFQIHFLDRMDDLLLHVSTFTNSDHTEY